MALPLDNYVVVVFLVFCRLGACLMIMPGLSSARVPMRVRLFAAVVLALVVTPLIETADLSKQGDGIRLLRWIFGEIFTGAIIGLVARLYIAALEFMGSAISSYIGLNGLGGGIETEEPSPSLSTMITVVATLMLLLLDLHVLLVSMVISSYGTLPIGALPDYQHGLRVVAGTLAEAFTLALQVSGPFVVYGVVVNVMFGILGKLIPQVPSYFVSVPFLAMGGLILLYFVIAEMLPIFITAMAERLAQL